MTRRKPQGPSVEDLQHAAIGDALCRHLFVSHRDTPPATYGWGTQIDFTQLLATFTTNGVRPLGDHVSLVVEHKPQIRILDQPAVSRWEITANHPVVVAQFRLLRGRVRILYFDFARDLSRVTVGLSGFPDWPIDL